MTNEEFKEELTKYLLKLKGVMPVGHPWWGFDIKSKPLGVQLYQGQILSREAYPVHWAYIQENRTIISDEEWLAYRDSHNGVCPYFSYGDGSKTYRMPRIIDVHPRFTNYGDNVGDYVEAGIPDIWGSIATPRHTSAGSVHEGTGAFVGNYPNGTSNGMYYGTSASYHVIYRFYARLCSEVYGRSDTVQPPAVNFIIGEYVVSGVEEFSTSTAETIQANIEHIETEMSQYLKSYDLEKYNTSYVVEQYSDGVMGWYRKWSNGWIEQGNNDTQTGTSSTITFMTPFKDTNYTIILQDYSATTTDTSGVGDAILPSDKTTTTCRVSKNTSRFISWYACGY